jgi:hypothetical protein
MSQYCDVFEYWDTQVGLLVGFISIFTSRNYTQLLQFQDCCDYNTQSLQFTSVIGLLTLVPLFTCSERLVFTSKLPTTNCLGQSHIATDGQSVSLGVEPHLGLMTRYLLLFDSYGLVSVGRPLWREDGFVFCICCWPLPVQSFSGQDPWD